MPKSSTFPISPLPSSPVAFTAPPRKVSFEDALSDQSISSDCKHRLIGYSGHPRQQHGSYAMNLSQRRSLARPKSSLSLVDLAKTVSEDSLSIVSFRETRAEPVSPILSPTGVPNSERSSSSSSLPVTQSSPWGHFVDTVMSDEDRPRSEITKPASHPNSAATTTSSARFLRRHYHRCYSPANPYGDYRRVNHRKLCFLRDRRKAPIEKLSVKQSKFRLAPRKESNTDNIIGAMVRLHFR